MKQSTIAIIGAGVVGSITAYTLMMHRFASKLLLVDINDIRCKGEVEDLSDAILFNNASTIELGTLQQAGQADIAIITAGIAQKPEQPRSELLSANREIISSIINGMKPLNPDLIIIMVTNPVDVLTYLAQQISGLPKGQVFGSGTLLDTQRLREEISKKLTIAQQSIHVYVLGEHGDNQFVAWSSATIAGKPLVDFPQLSHENRENMARIVRNKVYDIIACKGSTAFGVATCIAAYCYNIFFDTKCIMPISCYFDQFDVCMSVPAVIGNKGIEKIIMPPLNKIEQDNLARAAQAITKLQAL